MTGIEYESFVAKYLRQHGYHNVSVTKASGDYGVDVIAHKKGKKYAVQCKYYTKPVGISAVQEAVEIETAPLFGRYVKESSKTVITPPDVKN